MKKLLFHHFFMPVLLSVTAVYARSQPTTVQFRAWDKVIVTADLYASRPVDAPPNDTRSFFIRFGSNRLDWLIHRFDGA